MGIKIYVMFKLHEAAEWMRSWKDMGGNISRSVKSIDTYINMYAGIFVFFLFGHILKFFTLPIHTIPIALAAFIALIVYKDYTRGYHTNWYRHKTIESLSTEKVDVEGVITPTLRDITREADLPSESPSEIGKESENGGSNSSTNSRPDRLTPSVNSREEERYHGH